MSSLIVYRTRCALCDPKNPFQLEEAGFEPVDLQKGPPQQMPERLGAFQMKLIGHLQKAAAWEQKQLEKALKRHQEQAGPQPDIQQARHFQAWMEFVGRTALAQGSALMQAYDTQDPALAQMANMARLQLNVRTRKFFYTDDMLLDAVVKLNLDEQDQQNVYGLVQAIRDSLCEQGRYAPDKDQPTTLVMV